MMAGDSGLLELVNRGRVERDPAALASLRRRMVLDFVLCVVPELDRTSRFAGSELHAPTMYEIAGDHNRDKLFLGEVLDVGPGVTVNGRLQAVCVAPGDIALCNLSNISYRLQERGRKTYQIRNDAMQARLDPKDFSVRPLQDNILVRTNGKSEACPGLTIEDRARAHASGGPIWLPTDAMETDDTRERRRYGSGIVASYGEVVDQGPGCYRDGNWKQPDCKRGDLLLFDASFGTLPITIKGESFTLVPSDRVAQIADEV
jgi:co-chaperonin GroES (HSP10)